MDLFEQVKRTLDEIEQEDALRPVSDAQLRACANDAYVDMPENMAMAPTTLVLGASRCTTLCIDV